MKKFILINCLILSVITTVAQKQTNIWYFGNRVGLDFNQTPPIPLSNGTANSTEGSSSMSDNNGKLLFYSNGISIQNRKHETMLNGNFLNGDLSSTSNSVIVPMPGNDSMYYLFTIGSARQETPVLSYNVIDMKGDGGFGNVVQKNIFIADTSLEKLAAIRHCNNRDIWIVTRKWKTDQFFAYLLTSGGLNSIPVISGTGLIINGQLNNSIGVLKFSPKGNKLAAIHSYNTDIVELLDFDNATGIISNPLIFKPNSIPNQSTFNGVYGAEFSPDGKLLYISANNSITDPSTLYQFDITSNNTASILASKQIIAQTTPWFAGAVQLASDGKIYMAMWEDTAISVIENPNIYGPSCNFVFNKIKLGIANSAPVQFGLPNFMQSYFDAASNPYDFSRSGNCIDKSVSFALNRINGIDSVKWDFGDGQQSQILQPTHTYLSAGFKTVKLIVYKVDCSGLFDTISRKIWIADQLDYLGKDTSSCNVISIEIGIDEIEGANYLWNTGYNGNKIMTTGLGDYWLEISQNGCKIRDTVNITTRPKPFVNIGKDTSVCSNSPIMLRAGNLFADSYLWNTGDISSSITINKAGTYHVTVTENACISSDTVSVVPGDCDVFIPSAFTPNGDGRNDYFGVLTEFSVKSFQMQIFSKWSQVIFATKSNTEKWDGKFKGAPMPNGAYLWTLDYINLKGEKKHMQGTVMLIR